MQEAEELVRGHSLSEKQSFADRFEALRLRAGQSGPDFLDTVARYIAHEYVAGGLSYSVGDDIANELWGIALGIRSDAGELVIPSYMYSVYEAFDSGEYRRSDDLPGTDPAVKYTLPALEAIVAQDNAA